RPGDRLRRFVRLEADVERSLALGKLRPSRSLIAEHQVVVRLQILGIDVQRVLELDDRLLEPPLQEQDASQLVAHDAIAPVLRRRDLEMLERLVVSPEVLQDGAEEEMR